MAVRQLVLWTTSFLLTAFIPDCCGQCQSFNRPKFIEVGLDDPPITITSPGYPNEPYGSDEFCAWQIRLLTHGYDHVVHVYIEDMDLESQSVYCRNDFVSLYDDDHRSLGGSSAMIRLCTTNYGRDYYSSWRNMYITFTSDQSVQKRGFALQVKAVHKSRVVTTTTTTTPWWRGRTRAPTTTKTTSSEHESSGAVIIVVVVVSIVVLLVMILPLFICIRNQRRAQRHSQAMPSLSPSSAVLLGPAPRPPGVPSAPPLEDGDGGGTSFAGGPPSYLSLSQNNVGGESPRSSAGNGRVGLHTSDHGMNGQSWGTDRDRGARPASNDGGSAAGLPVFLSSSPWRGSGGELTDGVNSRAEVLPPRDTGVGDGPPAAPPSYDEVMDIYPPALSAPPQSQSRNVSNI